MRMGLLIHRTFSAIVVSMKRFYEPTLWTAIRSSSFIALALCAIVATAQMSDWVLLTGVAAIAIIAFVWGRSLTRAGMDAMMVRLSQFGRMRQMIILALATLICGCLFLALTVILITTSLPTSEIRFYAFFPVAAFFPVVVMLTIKLFEL